MAITTGDVKKTAARKRLKRLLLALKALRTGTGRSVVLALEGGIELAFERGEVGGRFLSFFSRELRRLRLSARTDQRGTELVRQVGARFVGEDVERREAGDRVGASDAR